MIGACQVNSLVRRSKFTDGVITTGKSFRSWDTCMDNKACKIIAIVGIVLAGIVGIWLIGALLTCFRQGVTGIGEFCCWCCNCYNSNPNRLGNEPINQGFSRVDNINGPPNVVYQPINMPERAYDKFNPSGYSDYDPRKDNTNTTVYDESIELEQDFDLEKQKWKRNNNKYDNKKRDSRVNLSPQRIPLTYELENFGSSDNLSIQDGYSNRNSGVSHLSYPMNAYQNRNPSPHRKQPSPHRQQYPETSYSFNGDESTFEAFPTRQNNRVPYPDDEIDYYEENANYRNKY
ncbi:[PSI+] induction protein 2 [Nakaseomyces bracarensis]|uniref:[PSI+] induction protein 2 n=1 Tax=Nakaseomyces bracarensis TaxID=273131 RepID=A0ABR4NMR7_9SACH